MESIEAPEPTLILLAISPPPKKSIVLLPDLVDSALGTLLKVAGRESEFEEQQRGICKIQNISPTLRRNRNSHHPCHHQARSLLNWVKNESVNYSIVSDSL